MESHSPEKIYEDRMNNNITMEDFRNQNANKILSLRKEKHNKDIISNIKGRMNLLYEPHYSIHFNLLKTNNDDIRNFFINLKNPDNTMIKLKYLLTSKDDDEVKYGLYAVRKHFQILIRELFNKEEDNFDNKVSKSDIDKKGNNDLEIFIKNNIIFLLFDIIKNSIGKNDNKYYINIYECLWIFINMTVVPPKNDEKRIEFFTNFVQKDNLNNFLILIQDVNTPQEITHNILILISNIAVNEPEIVNILINSDLTKILFSYLKNNKKINNEIFTKIYRVLNCLYINCYNNLSIDAYKTIFKVFSLPLYNFKKKEIIKYCLDILLMLAHLNSPEIVNCFNDLKLMGTLNNIIFDESIEGNEHIIFLILEIFYNLIKKDNKDLQKNIINSGSLPIFYNNLIKKFKIENKIINYQAEEDILLSINNLILFNHKDVVGYILSDGKVLLNYFMECAQSIYKKTRLLGTKSLLNILMDKDDQVKIEINILYDIVNAILETLRLNEFNNCYYYCIQCILLISKKSNKMNFNNELKKYLNNKGFVNYIDKIEIKLLNDTKDKLLDKEEQENYNNIIEEVKNFLFD